MEKCLTIALCGNEGSAISVMPFAEDLVFYAKRAETLEYELRAISNQKKDVYRGGDDTFLDELDTKLKAIEDQKEIFRREFHEALIRLGEIAQRGIESGIENFM